MATENPTNLQPQRSERAAEEETLVPLRHPGRTVGTVVVLVLLAILIRAVVTNERYEWSVVADYFFSKSVLLGLLRTLELTALGMVIALVLGIVLALMRQSQTRLVSWLAGAYIWFFRGTPLLVQLIFLYNISALYPKLSLGVPFGGPSFVEADANQLLTAFTVAVVGLGLNAGAYMCEIVRGGLLSIEKGQTEAAAALGMPGSLTFRRIVFPQAFRVMIPAIGNETIGMLKYTSLVSVISLPELLYSTQIIYTRTFQTIPLLTVACLWYLLVTTILSIGQMYLERHFGRGVARTGGRRRGRAKKAPIEPPAAAGTGWETPR